MVKRIQEHWNRAGQAIVEFALAATLIFFLLAAAVDLGLIFFTLQGLSNAAQEGARYGALWLSTDPATGERSLQETEIRNRVRFESGTSGGINFVNLHDLNNDGTLDVTNGTDPVPYREGFADAVVQNVDSEDVTITYIDVTLVGDINRDGEILPAGEELEQPVFNPETGGYELRTEDPDPDCLSQPASAVERYPCYVRVDVSYEYDVVFGLAPMLGDRITLTQSHTERVIDPFEVTEEQRFGAAPVKKTNTPTNTPTPLPTATATGSPTEGPSPTATFTNTPGPSPTSTFTPTPSWTPTNAPSATATGSPTEGPSPTATHTPTEGPSPTATNTATNTPTPTPRPDYFIALVAPNRNGNGELQSGYDVLIDSETEISNPEPYRISLRGHTRFRAIAYDRRDPAFDSALDPYDTTNDGKGIYQVEFQIIRPDGTDGMSQLDSIETGAAYCTFSGNNDSPLGHCAEVPDTQVGNTVFNQPAEGLESDQSDTYTLRARVRSPNSIIISDWVEYPLALEPLDAEVIPVYYDDTSSTYEDINNGMLLENQDLSRFRAIAYDETDSDYNSSDTREENDGAGINLVEYEFLDPFGYRNSSGTEDGSNGSDPNYCLFGADSPCDTMADFSYSELVEGTYTLKVRASNGFLWTDWVERTISVPRVDVFLAWMNNDIYIDPEGATREVLNRSDTDFRVVAYDPEVASGEPLATETNMALHDPFDGQGIEKIEFAIFSPYMFRFRPNDFETYYKIWKNNQWRLRTWRIDQFEDRQSEYCTFGPSHPPVPDAADAPTKDQLENNLDTYIDEALSQAGSCETMDSDEWSRFMGLEGTYTFQARAMLSGNDRWSDWVPVSVSPPSLPACDATIAGPGSPNTPWSAWTAADIGENPVTPGTVLSGVESIPADSLFICGSGDNLWGGSNNRDDGFHYTYRVAPNFQRITARLSFADTSTDAWSKIGLMVRSGPTDDAAYAAVMVTRDNGITMQRRETIGGGNNSQYGASYELPMWLRLEKSDPDNDGDPNITSFYSSDGTTWTEWHSYEVDDLGTDPIVGLIVTSHKNGDFARAIFSDITVE